MSSSFTIKDGDLIAGTHGRGFWILDDITPLRQVTPDIARAAAYLFRPLPAVRFRWNKNTDTPLPPDEPSAPNPPDGITLSYLLITFAYLGLGGYLANAAVPVREGRANPADPAP